MGNAFMVAVLLRLDVLVESAKDMADAYDQVESATLCYGDCQEIEKVAEKLKPADMDTYRRHADVVVRDGVEVTDA